MNIEQDGLMQKIYFNSLDDFYKYITQTPLNETFMWARLASNEESSGRDNWACTKNFDEAVEYWNLYADTPTCYAGRLKDLETNETIWEF